MPASSKMSRFSVEAMVAIGVRKQCRGPMARRGSLWGVVSRLRSNGPWRRWRGGVFAETGADMEFATVLNGKVNCREVGIYV
jgi:hypothetical protein